MAPINLPPIFEWFSYLNEKTTNYGLWFCLLMSVNLKI
ncbi:Hypothetical protein I595_3530 [Croceitalea dokdonensis DOKDO 023]|uniref:Uncharacterized protein n=1 Tax=Croceitalea dokdonensis DOKDO 023 TaxID=1300341 RepID=A0A0P7AD30_9FLAO|nr:Hypothetical protein I595_3530 [Croceitalea dokdonensis DOKDO 023]